MLKVRLVLAGLLAVLAVSAMGATSASATMPAFTTEAGALLTETSLEILGKKAEESSSGTLTTKVSGIELIISCAQEHATGGIHNGPVDGVGLILVHYLECTVSKPAGKGCLILRQLIHVSANISLLLGSGGPGTYQVDFTPDSPPNFVEITIDGCTGGAAVLNGTYAVTGQAVGEINNTNLTIKFSSTSGSELKFGANKATYNDEVTIEMLGGGGIMVEGPGEKEETTSASTAMPAFTTEAGTLLSEKLLEVLGKKPAGTANAVLKTKVSGIMLVIECSKEHATGGIHNGPGDGLGLILVHYLECIVSSPAGKGCSVKNQLIHFSANILLLLGPGGPGTYRLDYRPDPEPNFFELTIEKCTGGAAVLNGTYAFTGQLAAEINNTNLTFEFTETSGSELKFGVNSATYTDVVTVEMLGGGGIMVEDGN